MGVVLAGGLPAPWPAPPLHMAEEYSGRFSVRLAPGRPVVRAGVRHGLESRTYLRNQKPASGK